MNFPFICSNIPAASAYRVYISQLIRYSRTCGYYQNFLHKGLLLTRKLLNQGFQLVKLKSSHESFTVATMTWLTVMEYRVTNDHGYIPIVINTSLSLPHAWLITGFVTRLTRQVPLVEQKLLTLLEQLRSPRGSCYSIFSFICMFCRSLFVLLSFSSWSLCCLFSFDLRILATVSLKWS